MPGNNKKNKSKKGKNSSAVKGGDIVVTVTAEKSDDTGANEHSSDNSSRSPMFTGKDEQNETDELIVAGNGVDDTVLRNKMFDTSGISQVENLKKVESPIPKDSVLSNAITLARSVRFVDSGDIPPERAGAATDNNDSSSDTRNSLSGKSEVSSNDDFKKCHEAAYETSTRMFKRSTKYKKPAEEETSRSSFSLRDSFISLLSASSALSNSEDAEGTRSWRVKAFMRDYRNIKKEVNGPQKLKTQIEAYKTIYAAKHAKKGYKSSFLDKLSKLDEIQQYCAIREHAQQDPGSRTARAWSLSTGLVDQLLLPTDTEDEQVKLAQYKLDLLIKLDSSMISSSLISRVKKYYKPADETKTFDDLPAQEKLEKIQEVIKSANESKTGWFFSSKPFSQADELLAKIAEFELVASSSDHCLTSTV